MSGPVGYTTLHYFDTSWELSIMAGVSQQTIRRYAKKGLLDYILDDDGHYLFKQGQADKIRKLCEENKDVHQRSDLDRLIIEYKESVRRANSQ
jgi:predicted site-specific integrase-resolvase